MIHHRSVSGYLSMNLNSENVSGGNKNVAPTQTEIPISYSIARSTVKSENTFCYYPVKITKIKHALP